MKSSNQGFVDLHTPFGFYLIGSCFLLLTVVIIAGSILAKSIAAKEREVRAKLKADQELRIPPKNQAL